MKVGKGLHMLTSACGVEGMPLRESATPLQKRKLGAGVANTALPIVGPHLCLLLSRHKLLIFSAKAG